MKLTLTRFIEIEDATIGTLAVDGVFQCFTLEDVERLEKIKAVTAIPTGDYQVQLTESPRFSDKYEAKGLGRLVPLLIGVPRYKGVRIHVGNKATHSEGCILVGNWDKTAKKAAITGSTAAYKSLQARLSKAKDEIRIKIVSQTGKFEQKVSHPSPFLFRGMFGGTNMCTMQPVEPGWSPFGR
ncbi:hypothetical protein GXW71_03380 [Roseomonas hellenica]|uniref:DUF5675 domain-containing protein n=1 Tax=Plastoroseomonas hellenica TaxID=2687306 RepID=A0ABS5ETW7_9PROT|nr:DUF5675 family protein [Plastoroseomonas hellenica]MBR0663390.1 hypothetical protein [Plastoroseomonas hellenica]